MPLFASLILVTWCWFASGSVIPPVNNASVFLPPSVCPEILGDCVIDPFVMDPHPLIFRSGKSEWIYPIWGDSVLRFPKGTEVDFICPGRNVIIDVTSTGAALLRGTCQFGTTFLIDGKPVDWRLMSCNGALTRAIRATGNSCSGDGRELEAGFSAADGRFLRSLLICFSFEKQIAYYTYIYQTATINQRVPGTPRPGWVQGTGLYSLSTVTNLYLRTQQKATVNTLLGLPADSEKYIQDTGNFYLARGHLTARSDNFYAAQQNATFYMQNIAPQWQTFNALNWYQVELDVRDYAEESGDDLQVWTGVHGITTLPHEVTGVPTELYLFVNETHKLLPVPEIFYKVAYNPKTQAGVALIGVNNPYIEEFRPLCPDVSSWIPWFSCTSDLVRGYCYACTVPEFRKVVSVFPEFPVSKLLI